MYLRGACCDDCQQSSTGLAGLGAAAVSILWPPFNWQPILSVAEGMFANAFNALEDFFKIGAGRNEADVIVPVQNDIMQRLGEITDALVRGPSAQTLQSMYREVEQIGAYFRQFVSDSRFSDGRASEQALNDIMPYIDGSCGYRWPPPMTPDTRGCLRWGDGTPGGAGTDGMLGAIGRAIVRKGGMIPTPMLTQGPGVPSLSYPWPGTAQLPQAGTLPPRVPSRPLQAGIIPVGGGGSAVLPILLGAGALLFFSRR
jgi:hypothetical protein